MPRNKSLKKSSQDQFDLSIICEAITCRKKPVNIIFIGLTLLILSLIVIKYLPVLYTFSIKYQHYCHQESIRSNLFYIDVDLKELTFEERQLFDIQNVTCNITVLNSSVLPSYIELWNQLQSQRFGDGIAIQKVQKYSQNDQRLLLILLHMYMNGQTYLYPTQLLKNMQPKCLWRAYHGSELVFNKIDHFNESTNIYIPSQKFTMLKVGYKNNWMIKKLIKSLVQNKDFLQICNTYQCTIMDCDQNETRVHNYNAIQTELLFMQVSQREK